VGGRRCGHRRCGRLSGYRAGLAAPRLTGAGTTTDALDPLIHVPARLRIVATLAALPDGDTLSFTRLQNMIGLTPGNLITHLRKLQDAGYLSTEKTGNGVASRTSVALSNRGRAALDTYTVALRDLLGGL
jgi:DNA-binding transcriptional ArsR family regulator